MGVAGSCKDNCPVFICIADLHGSEAMMTCMDNRWIGALEVARLAGKRSAVGTVVGTPIFCVGTVGTVMNDFKILAHQ